MPDSCPVYLQPTVTAARESPSKKRKRIEDDLLKKAEEASILSNKEYEKQFRFSNLQELVSCLEKHNIEDFWTVISKKEYLLIAHLSETHDVICYISITKDLNVSACNRKIKLKKLHNYEFPLKVNDIHTFCSIMSSLKVLNESNDNVSEDNFKITCDVIIDLLKNLKECNKTSTNDSFIKLIDFMIEQLVNMTLVKTHRKYSPDLLIFCCLLKSISPHCYRFLRSSNIFILPHESTLKRICAEFNVNPCNEQDDSNFLSYVKQKYNFLEEKEKVVCLMIDEIHLKPNFDYVGGKLFGMSHDNSNAASSAFVFMLQSFLSSYKDVAHILPVSNLTAETFHEYIKKVIIGLENIGFKVITLVTDNNAINKKAVSLFASPSELCIKYKNPACPDRYFYFLFDSVHILKCLRNIWINQKNLGVCLFFPNFDDISFSTASF